MVARHGVAVTIEGDRADLATVTLDRPEQLNAQTPLTWAALAETAAALPASVRVVLVTAAGRAFSAGLDRAMFTPTGVAGAPTFPELAAMEPAAADTEIARYQAGFGWLARPDLISIAAVQGHAVGAGFQLALACDLRIVADDAQFSMAEVPLGLVPDLLGTRRLVELVGYTRAMEICLTGRRVGAAEALTLGLANRVVARAELADAARALAADVLAAPPAATAELKPLLLAASNRSPDEQAAAERAAQHRLLRRLAAG
ncbi:MAG: enoyl-CoA hydratase/isomerase family protein [bacterium]